MPNENLAAELASLRTEVRYLKFIIPSACGLVALLMLIFWGIERNHIGKRVQLALDEAGVADAVARATTAADEAEEGAERVRRVEQKLAFRPVEVIGTRHASGKKGQYFNYEISAIDAIAGNDTWDGTNFLIINTRTSKIGPAILWRRANGGEGSGHGRWVEGPRENQWKAGDTFTVIGFPG